MTFNKIYYALMMFFLMGCDSKNMTKSIIYTSDTHVSLPEGRYDFMTKRYQNFVKEHANEGNIFFINGDFIDSAYTHNGRVVGGDVAYQEKETKYFLDMTKKLTTQYKNKILLNFGVGHDFGSLPLAEELTNQNRTGQYRWGNVDLIWFTSKKGTSTSASIAKSNALNDGQYALLEEMISKSKNAIIFSHVPLRTDATYKYGKWSGSKNLTIPLSDPLYRIIDRNSENILAIFTGHIHRTYETNYKGIPIYSFPLISNDAHCKIEQKKEYIKVIPTKSNIKNKTIYLN